MAFFRKITTFFLLIFLLGTLVLPALATAQYQGLEVSVTMDKETYEPGEPITATITVTNKGSQTVTIANLEQLIPEGYVLAENSDVSMKDVEMVPGRILVLQVTFEGDTSENAEAEAATGFEGFVNTVLYGRTMGVPNMFIAVILAIALIIFFILT